MYFRQCLNVSQRCRFVCSYSVTRIMFCVFTFLFFSSSSMSPVLSRIVFLIPWKAPCRFSGTELEGGICKRIPRFFMGGAVQYGPLGVDQNGVIQPNFLNISL